MSTTKELILDKLTKLETISDDVFTENITDIRDELVKDITQDMEEGLRDSIEATLDSYYFETRSIKNEIAEIRKLVKKSDEQHEGIVIISDNEEFRTVLLIVANALANGMNVKNFSMTDHYEVK